MTATVAIAGREFKIGATYRGKPPVNTARKIKTMVRKLMAVRGGTVYYRTATGLPGWTGQSSWAKWAGEEVGT